MRGADLRYRRQECCRPRALEALGRGVSLCWLAFVLVALTDMRAGPAHADSGWLDEVKLGVLAHDIRFLGNHVEPGGDINVEVLFPSPAFLRVLWAPRPHLGLSINTAGATDYGYIGLTWRGRPWPFGQKTQTHHFHRVYASIVTCSSPCNPPNYDPYSLPMSGNGWDGMIHELEADADVYRGLCR